ncbi:MAG: hypothetical protein J4N30_06440 [Chloroflexi bacterium]|nr:hypothetical protein [Chloroflexota bacterium]
MDYPILSFAALICVPDGRWGEAVPPLLMLREGRPATAEDLTEFCRGKMVGFPRPRAVDFIDALPRNASGKVLKGVLRERCW